MTTETHGTSADGVELTDALIDKLTAEAEAGYDVKQLKPRTRRGRPPIGAGAAEVVRVRLEPGMRSAVTARAEHDGVNTSEVIRQALQQYLAPSR
jgi:hypothetical protein